MEMPCSASSLTDTGGTTLWGPFSVLEVNSIQHSMLDRLLMGSLSSSWNRKLGGQRTAQPSQLKMCLFEV